MIRDLTHAVRGLIARAVVRASADGGASQLVDVTVREGHERTAVEVLQPFGLAARAPAGALAVVLAVGGDQGDLVALPLAAPGARLGDLQAGEAALYGADGSRVHVKAGGIIEISAATAVHVTTPAGVIVIAEDGLRATFGADVEIELSEARARLRHGTNEMAAGASAAKLKAGAHFLAATAGGLLASGPINIGAEPDA